MLWEGSACLVVSSQPRWLLSAYLHVLLSLPLTYQPSGCHSYMYSKPLQPVPRTWLPEGESTWWLHPRTGSYSGLLRPHPNFLGDGNTFCLTSFKKKIEFPCTQSDPEIQKIVELVLKRCSKYSLGNPVWKLFGITFCLWNNLINPQIWKNRNIVYYFFKNVSWYLHIPGNLYKLPYLSLTNLRGITIFTPIFLDEENQAPRDFVLQST